MAIFRHQLAHYRSLRNAWDYRRLAATLAGAEAIFEKESAFYLNR